MGFLARNGKRNHVKNVASDEALPIRNLKLAKKGAVSAIFAGSASNN
jgi:hypothetical protein